MFIAASATDTPEDPVLAWPGAAPEKRARMACSAKDDTYVTQGRCGEVRGGIMEDLNQDFRDFVVYANHYTDGLRAMPCMHT